MNAPLVQQSDRQTFTGGFDDAVFEAQTAFRAIMQAMAEPGLIVPLDTSVKAPAPLNAVAAAALCTLCDADTTLYMDTSLKGDQKVSSWITFQTDVVIGATPSHSTFALIAHSKNLPTLDHFAQGTDEYPDRSTTIIVQTESLTEGPPLTLTGPGIKDQRIFCPADLPDHFTASWMNNHDQFPRGVDVIFATENELACLPRSTKLSGGF